MIDYVSDFHQRSNWVISDFRVYDFITLDDLHRTLCLLLYGFRAMAPN